MNHLQLHSIPKFAELFEDTRFKEALVHLRANFPSRSAASGDEWRGYFSALERLESLKDPPAGHSKTPEKSLPYTSRPTGNEPEKQS